MLRQSLTNTPQPAHSPKRKFSRLISTLVLAGAACLAIAMIGFGTTGEQADPVKLGASEAYLSSLVDHHQYLKS